MEYSKSVIHFISYWSTSYMKNFDWLTVAYAFMFLIIDMTRWGDISSAEVDILIAVPVLLANFLSVLEPVSNLDSI